MKTRQELVPGRGKWYLEDFKELAENRQIPSNKKY